jgi:transposase
MMGHANPPQAKLFYTDFNLEARIRADHPLRAIGATIDFDFVYSEVADRYGDNGNVSVAPPVVLKLMLLLVLYNVRSERELMATLPERLDWLWFLGFDLDSAVPDHSVLSKARTRWGEEVFKGLFERVVGQCVQAGLVDGTKIFVDSSLIEANASNGSIVDTGSLKARLSQRYVELQKRLQESEPEIRTGQGEVNRRHVSGTDPDAAIVNRGRPKLLYQTNRAVDSKAEVITAVEITRGDVNEAHLLVPLTEQHWTNTGLSPETVVADSKYGTIGNFLACHDRGLAAHIPDLKQAALKRTGSRGIFLDTEFTYDANTDTYTCPAGRVSTQVLAHQSHQHRLCRVKESLQRLRVARPVHEKQVRTHHQAPSAPRRSGADAPSQPLGSCQARYPHAPAPDGALVRAGHALWL